MSIGKNDDDSFIRYIDGEQEGDTNLVKTAAPDEKDSENLFDPRSEPPRYAAMFKLFIKLAVPAILTNVIGFLSTVINAIFAGRMNDPAQLAAVGLANVTTVIMIMSFLLGINAA